MLKLDSDRSTGVLGLEGMLGRLEVSLLEGGRGYGGGLAGDGKLRMTGIERLDFKSWAPVVVGSLRSPSLEGLLVRPLRLGVEGVDGAVGVGTLETEDCAE
jgi:hypothetical protein